MIVLLVRTDKKMHLENLFSKIDNSDTRKLFRLTREHLGWTSGDSPTTLVSAGKMITKPTEVANCINRYFIEKIRKLKKDIPDSTEDPLKLLKTAMDRWKGKQNRKVFNFRNIKLSEITDILKNLKNSTTMGFDCLDAMTLKLVATTISKPLLHVLNTSIQTKVFCNKWKFAKILPLYKGEGLDRNNPKSFRPISILPIVSKIMEKSIQIQILDFMNESRQFNVNLHAYRKLYNTTTAALQLSDFTMEAADNNMVAQAMYLDQSAAFDCVSADILNDKLELYGFSSDVRKWINSYMTFRTQIVQIGASLSSMLAVESGVPQGSVLGPIFYLLYTNEFPEIMREENCQENCKARKDDLFSENCRRCGLMICYADDSTLVTARNNSIENIDMMRNKLIEVTKFLQSNKLSINQGKSMTQNFMVNQKRARVQPDPPVLRVQTVDGEKQICNQEHVRLLGLNIQRDLSWKAQLESGTKPLLNELRKRLGGLKHLGRQIPRKGRQILANGMIQSKLTYMIAVWGGTHRKYLDKLQRLQNNTARFVINGGQRWKSEKLLNECGWLSVREMVNYHSNLVLWKVLHHQTPRQLREKFHLTEDWKVSTSLPRLQVTSTYWRWRVCHSWNEMSEEVRKEVKISVFKNKMKKWILDKRKKDKNYTENQE